MWSCNGLGMGLGWCFNIPAPSSPWSRASHRVPKPLQAKLNYTGDKWRLLIALPRNTQKNPICWCGRWPSSYKSHFWFPFGPCGWSWVLWEGVSARFLEKDGQSQHSLLSFALPGAQGRQLEMLQPWIPSGTGAWDVPARRDLILIHIQIQIQIQGLRRAEQREQEPPPCFKLQLFLLKFAFLLPSN